MSCVTCCAVLIEPQLLDIIIVQFRNEKVGNHGSIPITIDCNVVAFIVFEEIMVLLSREENEEQSREENEDQSREENVATTEGEALIQEPNGIFLKMSLLLAS
ncbi:hypothetical protein TNCV_256531 [Trichonephila clavipes]|nr:hypothetical protein TNCV_256531 [Trichonephila clavipes]